MGRNRRLSPDSSRSPRSDAAILACPAVHRQQTALEFQYFGGGATRAGREQEHQGNRNDPERAHGPYHMRSESRPIRAPRRYLQRPPLPRDGPSDPAGAGCCRTERDRGRHHRAAGSHRPRATRRRPGRNHRGGARHGMGDGARAPSARTSVRQRRARPLSHHDAPPALPRGRHRNPAACSAWTSTSAATPCTSATSTSARHFSSGGIRARLAAIVTQRHVGG